MKYEQLIEHCLKIMQTYNPVIMSLDSHTDEYLAENCKKSEDTEKIFIKQVFYGTFRYAEFLKVLTKSLFTSHPSTTNIKDENLYFVIGYLFCFRFDELPYNELQKIILSQDVVKMNVFLSYLFDINLLNTHARPGWIELYDIPFVDNKVIGHLEDKIPQVADLLTHLSEKATGKKSQVVLEMEETNNINQEQDQRPKKEPTKPQPFNLTQPKPKQIPEPIKIPKQIQTKPVPASMNKTSLQQIEDEKKRRREEIKEQVKQNYEQSEQKPFQFELDKRPTNKDKIQKEVEEKFNQQLQFENAYYKPPPKFTEPSDVKLNVAAILREDQLFQKKKKEEEKRIKDLEWNLRDSAEFDNWKQEVTHKEKIQQMEYQQRKKIEMELAREAAIKAAEEKQHENKQTAEEMKRIAEIMLKQKEEKMQEEHKRKQNLIEGVLETRDNAQKEKEKMVDEKKKVHDESKKHMELLLEKKKEEELAERRKREELIREIRELERQPKKRTKGYDPSETVGLGLLNEMSMVELRERLEQVKREQLEQQEKQRQDNLQKRDKQLSSIQQKVNMIKEQRESNQKQKEFERFAKKEKEIREEELKQRIKEQSLLEVHEKIVDKKGKKRKEEQRLAKEIKEIQMKRQYMNANAAIVEEKAWKSQQDGAEREIKTRQISKLIDQEKQQNIAYKERKIMAEYAKDTVQAKIESNKDYDERMEKANKENEQMHRQVREYKKQMHASIKAEEDQHLENMRTRDPFKYEMSMHSLNQAKAKLQKEKEATGNKKQQSLEDQLPQQQFYEEQEEEEEE